MAVNAQVNYVVDTTQAAPAAGVLDRVAASSTKVGTSAIRMEKALATASARAQHYGTQANKASLYTANLGAQFNDIGVMLAAGQSPLMLAVQQGTQINQVMAQIGGTATDKAKAFKAALGAMFNATSLLTIGTIAAGAAVAQFALKAIRSTNDVMDLEDAVKAADDALKSFGDAADDANLSFSGLLKEFGSASPAMKAALQDIASIEKLRAAAALDEMAKSVAGLVTQLSWWDDRSAQSAAQDFLGLSSLGSTSREAAAEFARLLVVMEESADASERLQAAMDLRQMLSDATNGFTSMNDAQEEFLLNLAFVIRNAEILGGKLKAIGDGEEARYANLIKSYGAYADARIKSVEAIAKAEEEATKFAEAGLAVLLDQAKAAKEFADKQEDKLAAIEREMEVNKAILAYGADSVQVAEAKRKAYEEAAMAAELAAGYDQQAAEETVKAMMAAYDLAEAVGRAADEAKRYSDNISRGYDDGTAAGTGNAGDGYSGVSGGNYSIDSLGGRSSMSFSIYVPDERPLVEYFDFVEGGIKDIDRELDKFVRDNSGAMSDAIFTGGADPLSFWQSFRTLAVDSYSGVLEELFSDGGAATNFIAKSLENVLNANIDRINANIENFNEAVRNIDVSDAIRRSADGMTLRIDLNKFRDMEDDYFKSTRKLIGSALTGQLGGKDGEKTWANLKTFFENTRTKSWTDLNGEKHTNTVKYTDREIKQLNAVGKLFGNIVGDIQDKITMFSEVIGGRVGGFGKILQKFNIDLGKDAKAGGKLSKLVLQEFEDYSDSLAKRALKGRDDLQRAGESWTDTLERLADDFLGVSSTLAFMGQKQLQKATLNNADYASELAKLFGGVEAFNESAMSFFNIAYSPEQQQGAIEDYIQSALEAAGIKRMPKTRQQLQNMAEGYDLKTASGRRKYAALLELAELFDVVLPAWDSAEEAAQESLNSDKSFVLERLDDMIAKAKEAQSAYARLAESLGNAADDMRKSALTPIQSFQVLQREFNNLYAKGLTGDIEALEAVGGAATAYINSFADQAANAADLRFATAVTANKLDTLSDTAKVGEALSEYQVQQLEKLSEQVEDGKIRNQLVQDVVDAVGGLDSKLFGAIGALFTAQTGKSLSAVNRSNGTVQVQVNDDPLNYLSNASAVVTSGGNSTNDSGGGVTAVVSASTDDQLSRLRTELKTLIRKELRAIRRGNRYQKRSMRTLEDIYENGLP